MSHNHKSSGGFMMKRCEGDDKAQKEQNDKKSRCRRIVPYLHLKSTPCVVFLKALALEVVVVAWLSCSSYIQGLEEAMQHLHADQSVHCRSANARPQWSGLPSTTSKRSPPHNNGPHLCEAGGETREYHFYRHCLGEDTVKYEAQRQCSFTW